MSENPKSPQQTTDIADRLWDNDEASALTNEGAREIERLRDLSGARWAEIEQLRALVSRLTGVARDLAAGVPDPGTEALAAIYCGEHFVYSQTTLHTELGRRPAIRKGRST